VPYKHCPNISHPVQTWQVLRDFLAECAGAGEGIARVATG
jgi:hypothetical protein